MSIEIDVNSIHTANTDTVIHSIPCEIELNGEAKVDQYFTTAQRTVTEGGEKCEHQTNTWLIYFFCFTIRIHIISMFVDTHTHICYLLFLRNCISVPEDILYIFSGTILFLLI